MNLGALLRCALFVGLWSGLVGPAVAQTREPWPVLIRARHDIPVPARTSATVVERIIARSTRVAKGDLLLRLDSVLPELHRERAQAALQRAEAELQWTEAELARERNLAQGGSGSVSNLERLEAEAKVRTAALRVARADVGIAEEELRRTEVRAPRAGIVVEIYPEVGAMVQAGTPVVRLLSDDDLVAETYVSAADLKRFTLGDRYALTLAKDQREVVTLTEITPAAGSDRSFRLWFTPLDPAKFPPPGTDAWLPGSEGNQ